MCTGLIILQYHKKSKKHKLKLINLPLICFFILASNQERILAKFSNNSKNFILENKLEKKIDYNYSKGKTYIKKEINKFLDFLALGIENENYESKDDRIGIEIISDIKSKTNDEIIAKGNVFARTNSAVLKTDYLQYNSESSIYLSKAILNLKLKINSFLLLKLNMT